MKMDLKTCLLLVFVVVGFLTHENVAERGFCHIAAETGPCKARMQKYAYDPNSKTCTKFIYGGCGGNANNFATLAECEQACKH